MTGPIVDAFARTDAMLVRPAAELALLFVFDPALLSPFLPHNPIGTPRRTVSLYSSCLGRFGRLGWALLPACQRETGLPFAAAPDHKQ